MKSYPIDSKMLGTGALALAILGGGLTACSNDDPETRAEPDDANISVPVSEVTRTLPKPAQSGSISPTASDIRSADSHVHGGATLSIAVDGFVVFVELETPIYNILGFEYEPRSTDEKSRARQAEEILTQPGNVLRFNEDADCTYDPLPEPPKLFAESHAEDEVGDLHDHHEDNEHDHHEDHESKDHDDDHENDHEDHGSEHKDVILSYVLKCQNAKNIKSVQIELFDDFTNFSDLELIFLGQNQQMSAELSPSQSKADLTK